TSERLQALPCPSPDLCEFGKGGLCKPYGRLHVVLGEDDELGSFVFRTTGFNSIRTLAARLRYYQAVSGDLLACLPLALKLRGKSTTQSHRAPIYYVDLTIRDGLSLTEAIAEARRLDTQRKESGFYQQALDEAARTGFGNAVFEIDEDEGQAIVEEFYSDVTTAHSGSPQIATTSTSPAVQQITPLREKLAQRTFKQQHPTPP